MMISDHKSPASACLRGRELGRNLHADMTARFSLRCCFFALFVHAPPLSSMNGAAKPRKKRKKKKTGRAFSALQVFRLLRALETQKDNRPQSSLLLPDLVSTIGSFYLALHSS